MIYKLAIGNKKFEVEIGDVVGGQAEVTVNGESYDVMIENYNEIAAGGSVYQQPAVPAVAVTPPQRPRPVSKPKAASTAAGSAPTVSVGAGAEGAIIVPIPGRILDVKVSVGDHVNRGQLLAIMEAMKMENNILATINGVIKEVRIQKGSEVATGDVVMIIG